MGSRLGQHGFTIDERLGGATAASRLEPYEAWQTLGRSVRLESGTADRHHVGISRAIVDFVAEILELCDRDAAERIGTPGIQETGHQLVVEDQFTPVNLGRAVGRANVLSRPKSRYCRRLRYTRPSRRDR